MNFFKTVCAVLLFALFSPPAHSRRNSEKSVSGLDITVVKVEKKADSSERGEVPAAASEKLPDKPIAARFVKRENVVYGAKVGLRLYLQLENMTNRRFDSFSGRIVFMDAARRPLYAQKYLSEEAFEGGEKITLAIAVPVGDSRVKTFFKLLKAPVITVDFVDQKFDLWERYD